MGLVRDNRPPPPPAVRRAWPVAGGLFVGLCLAKFGNPAVLDRLIAPPKGALETIFQPWPLAWAYALLAVLAVLAVLGGNWRPVRMPPLVWLPAIWFVGQVVSAVQSVEPSLTRTTLPYLGAAAACYYVGFFGMGRSRLDSRWWLPVVVGFVWMLYIALDQHYGGLEATRRLIYAQPDWQSLQPEYLKRIASNRVFGTMMYPNALAGAILLLLPILGTCVWEAGARFHRLVRLTLTALLGWAGVACLYWSGSKAGWLIALVVLLVVVLRLPMERRVRLAIFTAAVTLGLTGFGLRFAGYFARGATSASARMDYWRAGWTTFAQNPVLGSGPGTFAACYRRIKPPDAEMALLTHNDYLQQASDSGAIGAAVYATFVAGSIVRLRRTAWATPAGFALWLGLLAWALQSTVEFSLYIPAVGWTAFLALGWLGRQSVECGAEPTAKNRFDKPPRPA